MSDVRAAHLASCTDFLLLLYANVHLYRYIFSIIDDFDISIELSCVALYMYIYIPIERHGQYCVQKSLTNLWCPKREIACH